MMPISYKIYGPVTILIMLVITIIVSAIKSSRSKHAKQ